MSDNEEIVKPVVHLNGSDVDDLISKYRNVKHALQKARDALYDAMPHGRDYYVHQDLEAYQKAREQFNKRLNDIENIIRETNVILFDLHEQKNMRKRR